MVCIPDLGLFTPAVNAAMALVIRLSLKSMQTNSRSRVRGSRSDKSHRNLDAALTLTLGVNEPSPGAESVTIDFKRPLH